MVSKGEKIEHGAADQPEACSARQRFIDAKMVAFPAEYRDRMPDTSDPRELEAALSRLHMEYSRELEMKAREVRDRERKQARRRR
jgi:hypothetical protein